MERFPLSRKVYISFCTTSVVSPYRTLKEFRMFKHRGRISKSIGSSLAAQHLLHHLPAEAVFWQKVLVPLGAWLIIPWNFLLSFIAIHCYRFKNKNFSLSTKNSSPLEKTRETSATIKGQRELPLEDISPIQVAALQTMNQNLSGGNVGSEWNVVHIAKTKQIHIAGFMWLRSQGIAEK